MKSISKAPLDKVHELVSKFSRKVVAADDAAVAEFVRQQCQGLTNMGEFLIDYDLVRESETSLTGMKVTYKLVYNRTTEEVSRENTTKD